MDGSVQIPVPAASDVESVVTALEMAALFGAKGEGNEAVRWLKRAAESAGAEGHDERALALARTAADLDDQLRSAPDYGRTPSESALPAASPVSSPTNGGGSDAEALPIPLGRRSAFPKPPSRPPSSTSSLSPAPTTSTTRSAIPEGGRPPAPSQRTQPPPKPPLSQRSPQVAAAARRDAASTTPSAPRVGASRHPQAGASRPSALPSAPRPSSLTPAPSSVRATVSTKPSSSIKPEPKPDGAAATVRATNGNGSNGNGSHSVTNGPTAPEVNGAHKSAEPEKPIKLAKGSVCSRQTARVSVQASTEPGVYVMRLLDDDETTLPGRAVEGLLVLVDPDAKLPTEDSN